MSKFLDALSQGGVDVDTLVGDLPICRSTDRLAVVDWSHFAELLARLERHVGGPEALENLGAAISEIGPGHVVRRIGRLAGSPESLYRAAEQWVLPRALPSVSTDIESLPDGQLSWVMETAANQKACPQIFHLFAGVARSLPRLVDLPQSVVRSKVSERRLELLIRPPPSGSLAARVFRAIRATFATRRTFHRLQLHQLELHEHFLSLEKSYAELMRSESRYRQLVESRVDTIVQLSASGQISYVSPSIEKLTGYRPDQILGSHYALWLHREDEQLARKVYDRILSDQGPDVLRRVVRIRHERGDWILAELKGRSTVSEHGERSAVVVIKDLAKSTERDGLTVLSEELIEAQVAERTRLFERRNHDLRELQGLLLSAERDSTAREVATQLRHALHVPLAELSLELEGLVASAGERASDFERILERADQVGEAAERTLDVYSKQKVELAPADPKALMADLQRELGPMTARRDVSLCCWIREPVGSFEADMLLIERGLLCIAEEALESLGAQDELGVEIGPSTVLPDAVEIRLWDTGPTAPESRRDERPKSAPGTTESTRRRNIGVGMAVARTIARGHRGQIRLEEREGGGNLVTLTLPRSPSDLAQENSPIPTD